jgi:ubiquinone/menaquinone biosynthesis C-methylase UbiE
MTGDPHINYRGKIKDRATSSNFLSNRLSTNKKFSSRDFFDWHLSHLALFEGMEVLDVGCGTGAQALPISRLIGASGRICGLDISDSSINTLKINDQIGNIEAIASDMMNLRQLSSNSFSLKLFDLVMSTYALYYADDPVFVLDIMTELMKPNGAMAIFVPDVPHGMVDFVSNFCQIPKEVTQSLHFARSVLEPYFRSKFWDVSIHLYRNEVKLPDSEKFMAMYKATTYFDEGSASRVEEAVVQKVETEGCFTFNKNGYLIVGKNLV